MKKFCCEKFKFLYLGDKTMGLNIRIIKLNPEILKKGFVQYDKIFYITEGYDGNINECEKKIVINYCPFCGLNIREIYANSDDYIQEIV